MFVVFLLHHDVTVGLGVGSGVSMGPLSADTQPPAVVGRLGLVLDTELGFCRTRRTDGRRNRAPPRPLFFEQETNFAICDRNGTRISISVYLRFQSSAELATN